VNVSGMVMGTWALNTVYRSFGASIGSYTSFRKVPAVNVPDMPKMATCEPPPPPPPPPPTFFSLPHNIPAAASPVRPASNTSEDHGAHGVYPEPWSGRLLSLEISVRSRHGFQPTNVQKQLFP